MMWHVLGVVWAVSILTLITFLVWESRGPAETVIEDLAWKQHCDDALAVARDGYTEEALAAADLALWEMEIPT